MQQYTRNRYFSSYTLDRTWQAEDRRHALPSSVELAQKFYIDGPGAHIPTSLRLDWFAICATTCGFQTGTIQENQIDWAEEYDQQTSTRIQQRHRIFRPYNGPLLWNQIKEDTDGKCSTVNTIGIMLYVFSVPSAIFDMTVGLLPLPTSSGLSSSILRRATFVTNPLRLLCPARCFPMRLNKEMMSEDDLLFKDQDQNAPITYPYKAENNFGRSFEGCKGFGWFRIFVSNDKVRGGVCLGLKAEFEVQKPGVMVNFPVRFRRVR
ncbi:uncharacterized protein APUU_70114A [Aspergillus puulaauensis]|uniref:Uncharacterized protein n=1 Tax=Aspergillus puulaauensis TaxID=1220207 RepID=A0A7R7XXN5_9EURO|nr:uncharacterized protein APUU_70114A [Aspergillus puulaauensis]BCS28544.1 hypothetical protein APUU_70114A [Aspergillus puulaauensis]